MEINVNKIAICGIKITTPPIPGIIPSAIKFVNVPGGNTDFTQELKLAKAPSIKSIG